MKIKRENIQAEHEGWPEGRLITFIPETVEEQQILGGLRNHFFFGDPNDKTFPEYDGVTSDGNLVTSLKLKYSLFE